MFKLFQKGKIAGETVTLKLSGLHCSSCSLNIDDALEETPGVLRASTSYAQQVSVVRYDPTKVSVDKIREVVESLDYRVIAERRVLH